MWNEGTGSTVSNVRIPVLEALRIPRLGSQEHIIGEVLGALDDKIDLNRRMNWTLETMARAIFEDWFVDFGPTRAKIGGRAPYLAPDVWALFPDRLDDDGKPEGWNRGSIGEIALVIDCLHSKKPERRQTGRPFLQLTNIRDDGLLDMTDVFLISDADYEKWVSRMEAGPGDCVITNVGRVGAVCQIPGGVRAALGRNMTGVRCRASFPYPTFLLEALLSTAMREEIAKKTDTGTILNALNVRSIPNLGLMLPPRKIADAFEKLCRPHREKMEMNIVECETLARVRDLLLPRLMSGQIRVKDAEKIAEAAL